MTLVDLVLNPYDLLTPIVKLTANPAPVYTEHKCPNSQKLKPLSASCANR
jgi:hypothetical protein